MTVDFHSHDFPDAIAVRAVRGMCRKTEGMKMRDLFVAGLLAAVGLSASALFAEGVADEASVPYRQWQRAPWLARFERMKARAASTNWPVAFVGDSIIDWWPSNGRDSWKAHFTEGPYRALNVGIMADRTENVLWRLRHGQLGKADMKAIVLLIGTNNTGHRIAEEETPLDTTLGVYAILRELRRQAPQAKIILSPLFPRGEKVTDPYRVRNDLANAAIRTLADGKDILWCDVNSLFLDAAGNMKRELFPKDWLHPGEKGYALWAAALIPWLDYALGRRADLPPPLPAAKTACVPAGCQAGSFPRHWLVKGPQYPVHKVGVQEPGGRLGAKRREIRANREALYDLVMMGDSITHFWEVHGREAQKKHLGNYRVLDVGNGSDCTANTVWLARNGLLDTYQARVVSLLIGTNDLTSDRSTPEGVTNSIAQVLKAIRQKQPQAKIVLFSILPRTDKPGPSARVRAARPLIRALAEREKVAFVDLHGAFLAPDGTPRAELFAGDRLHLTAAGYDVWGEILAKQMKFGEDPSPTPVRPAIVVQPLADGDFLEPSIANEVDHAWSLLPTNPLPPATSRDYALLATNGLSLTSLAIRLVSLQRPNGRIFVGTNDVTSAGAQLLGEIRQK